MRIYIDGENFRKGLEGALRKSGVLKGEAVLKKYDIVGLLKDVLQTRDLEIFYYASRVKLPMGYQPSERILEAAEKVKEESRVWLANVVAQKIKLIKAGNLKIKESKPCYHCRRKQETLQEKGVDVRVAVDLLEAIYDGKKKKMGLFSSDTDLCPVLHKAADKGAKVVYICFANGVNRAVSAVAAETVTVSMNKVKKYFKG